MATRLAIVEIDGKKYFDDCRLKEYRHVKDIMDSIPYDQLGDRKVKLVTERMDLANEHRKQKLKRGKRL